MGYPVHRLHGGGPQAQDDLGYKTRQEVAAKLAKALSDWEGGLTFDAEGLKLGEYLDRWLVDSVRDTVKLTTYQGYERICRLHIKPFLGQFGSRTCRLYMCGGSTGRG